MTFTTRRTLIGFDGSPGAYDAVALAHDLVPDAAALLVYVPPGEDPVARHYRPVESPAAFFDRATAMLPGAKVDARSYAGASPAHVLCDLTDKEALDLVVVGSPHRGAIGRALIGSVAEALVHGAGAPVVLAPAVTPIGTTRRRAG
jgi:nucleotide-binding universal stress UspA family protein